MYSKIWANDQRKNMICVDSYEDGILKGRIYDGEYGCVSFPSLSRFLIEMERLLDEKQLPQSYTAPRSFIPRSLTEHEGTDQVVRRGEMATFEIRVLFRQNTSWQGSIHWREKDMDQSFRSVLELVMLMDSALQAGEQT